ncbi:B3 domain-containing protein Os07g0563300-like [Rhodamnia argentea]|uniref:B3 domain-containing protein Os07g0563300-like n=1 Tax=Rhodamnia argentea TaxID=178133 RepID=A0A8B8QUT4_9MYRT|nr:B3 domain-containing protein Os07g0563300-like [Rhodamnia argentea]
MAYHPVCFSGDEESTCFYCKRGTAQLRPGWRLSNGGYAQLCDECASAYEDGTFCETYHPNADGWRNCNTCQKLLHCGCIMSAHAFVVLDFGGVSCMDCSRNDFIQDTPEAQQKLDEPQAVGLCDVSVEMAVEIQYEAHLSAKRAPAVPHATPGETAFQNVISSAPYNESSPLTDYGVMIS